MPPKGKTKPSATTVAASSATTVAVEDLFISLNRHIRHSQFDQAVKVADQVLAVLPNDEDAMKCKVVALIKAKNIDEALSTIEKFSDNSPIDFNFFKAYCLYRKNKLDEALESLRGQEGSTAAMLLESQVLYRLGKMDACVHVQEKLLKSKIDFLEINVVAGLVSAGRASEVQGAMDLLRVKPTSSFDLAYNTACSLIERDKYKDAEQLLLSARRIGQETLMEQNATDDEIEFELAPIAVQLAYVQQILGNAQEAMGSYINIIKKNLADTPSLAVATNNLIALRGPKDASDSLRKLDKLIEKGDGTQSFRLASGLDLKLSTMQREAIFVNRVLLLLHSNKMDQARELVAALPSLFPDSVMPVLLQAALHVRENKAGKAEEILGQYANKFPANSKIVLLARAQVAAAAGHPQIAAESLAKISDIQYKPATVATLVALKERAGDIDGAIAIFDSAIQWWKNAMTEDYMLDVIMQNAAAFKLKHGRKEEAASLYEQLVKSHGSTEALVGLIRTTAYSDIEKAEAFEKQLKPLPGLKAIDVDSLEKTSCAKNGQTASLTEAYEAKNKEKAKKKRKRKPKYPKGFDPANPGPPPDPERWLPKRERSSYRPKRKDKRAAQIRGSQGAVAKESASTSNSKSNMAADSRGATSNSTGAEQSKAPAKSSKKKSRR